MCNCMYLCLLYLGCNGWSHVTQDPRCVQCCQLLADCPLQRSRPEQFGVCQTGGKTTDFQRWETTRVYYIKQNLKQKGFSVSCSQSKNNTCTHQKQQNLKGRHPPDITWLWHPLCCFYFTQHKRALGFVHRIISSPTSTLCTAQWKLHSFKVILCCSYFFSFSPFRLFLSLFVFVSQVSPCPPSQCCLWPTVACSWWRKGRDKKPCWPIRSRRSQWMTAKKKQNKLTETDWLSQTSRPTAPSQPDCNSQSAPILFTSLCFCFCLSEARRCFELWNILKCTCCR